MIDLSWIRTPFEACRNDLLLRCVAHGRLRQGNGRFIRVRACCGLRHCPGRPCPNRRVVTLSRLQPSRCHIDTVPPCQQGDGRDRWELLGIRTPPPRTGIGPHQEPAARRKHPVASERLLPAGLGPQTIGRWLEYDTGEKADTRLVHDAPTWEIARWIWLIRLIRYPRAARIHRVSPIHRVIHPLTRQLVLLVLA
jgi:hypothetical protein